MSAYDLSLRTKPDMKGVSAVLACDDPNNGEVKILIVHLMEIYLIYPSDYME